MNVTSTGAPLAYLGHVETCIPQWKASASAYYDIALMGSTDYMENHGRSGLPSKAAEN